MVSLIDALSIGLKRPGVIYRRLSIILSNRYFRRERERWLDRLTGMPVEHIRCYIAEIENDKQFLNQVRSVYKRNTDYFPLPTDFMTNVGGNTIFFHCVSLYAIVRLLKPEILIETGGTPGKSSAFILRAMERNNLGSLYTIDLPPNVSNASSISISNSHQSRSYGSPANWAVPDGLRSRQNLLLGPAQEHLPILLNELGYIDLFLHDSDHSYSHMMWEFRKVFSYMRKGGLLLSDDIQTNSAWSKFCTEVGLIPCNFTSQGAARKI